LQVALKEHFQAPHDADAYIMETFPIVRKRDVKRYGTYRTKDRILEIYDAMAEAMRTGRPYQNVLDPPTRQKLDSPIRRFWHDQGNHGSELQTLRATHYLPDAAGRCHLSCW
jgi:hypothetical protein